MVPAPLSDPLRLGLPIGGLHLHRLEELERVTGGTASWGRTADGAFFVDVTTEAGTSRHLGPSLHLALSAAFEAVRGAKP